MTQDEKIFLSSSLHLGYERQSENTVYKPIMICWMRLSVIQRVCITEEVTSSKVKRIASNDICMNLPWVHEQNQMHIKILYDKKP